MIENQTLEEAIVEAERFLKAARLLRQARATTKGNLNGAYRSDVREHPATLRASLDLTHKLADMREGRAPTRIGRGEPQC